MAGVGPSGDTSTGFRCSDAHVGGVSDVQFVQHTKLIIDDTKALSLQFGGPREYKTCSHLAFVPSRNQSNPSCLDP